MIIEILSDALLIVAEEAYEEFESYMQKSETWAEINDQTKVIIKATFKGGFLSGIRAVLKVQNEKQ